VFVLAFTVSVDYGLKLTWMMMMMMMMLMMMIGLVFTEIWLNAVSLGRTFDDEFEMINL